MRVWEWLETIVLKSLGVRVVFEFFGKVRGCGFLMGCGFLKFVGGRNGFECARKVLGKFEGVGWEGAWKVAGVMWAWKVRGKCVESLWKVRRNGRGKCAESWRV